MSGFFCNIREGEQTTFVSLVLNVLYKGEKEGPSYFLEWSKERGQTWNFSTKPFLKKIMLPSWSEKPLASRDIRTTYIKVLDQLVVCRVQNIITRWKCGWKGL